ncbi:LysM peptidoglycan-binding domain-containing M23 family metallopeptidase [Lyngbya confervoides]|uniref:LysM peptidoglycan-binding domain-containing M23 family metallopeptidase n=1 Tax=Lyngbya confervoides TaxID=207921 RepID=UPI002548651E|nr:LysM peptidoglycan-binding domain-containing M23 family metallopeptidase [Lyngbya confervoides]
MVAPQQQASAKTVLRAEPIQSLDSHRLADVQDQLNLSPSYRSRLASAKSIANELKQTRIDNFHKSALAQSGAVVHQVRDGETLASIAEKYEVSVQTLADANRMMDPDSIVSKEAIIVPTTQSPPEIRSAHSAPLLNPQVGTQPQGVLPPSALASVDDGASQLLETDLTASSEEPDLILARVADDPALGLPDGETSLTAEDSLSPQPSGVSDESQIQVATVQNLDLKGDQGDLPAVQKPGLDLIDIPVATRGPLPKLPDLDLPPLVSDNYLPSEWQSGTVRYIWPAKGTFTSGFGWRWGRMHRGIDIAAPVGTPITAAAPGVITYSQYNSGGFGNLVEVTHPDGSLTLYAHNNRNLVRAGQYVSQGQQIAEMGSTGRSTGPHLHFELHPAGQGAVNPVALLGRG